MDETKTYSAFRFSESERSPDNRMPAWLHFVRETNGVAEDRGEGIVFGAPEQNKSWWAGGRVEEYAEARIIFAGDESVRVVAKTDRAQALMAKAAELTGF